MKTIKFSYYKKVVTSEELEAMLDGTFKDVSKVEHYIYWARYCLMLHSCIYYQLSDMVITDYDWDMLAKDLAEVQDNYPDISETMGYYDDKFEDWTGATGCHLPHFDFMDDATALVY